MSHTRMSLITPKDKAFVICLWRVKEFGMPPKSLDEVILGVNDPQIKNEISLVIQHVGNNPTNEQLYRYFNGVQ